MGVKYTRSQLYFLGGVFFWVGFLQTVMLWHLSAPFTICNAHGAWPLSDFVFLGGSVLTGFLTIAVAIWAWKSLAIKGEIAPLDQYQPFFWALIVGTGLSHFIERVSSECVLDYWHIIFLNNSLHFNLGDVSLTIGVLFFIGYWLRVSKHKV